MNENETRIAAAKIAAYCRMGDLLILDGEPGAGKTHFTKWFVDSLQGGDVVTSPTFSIANFYSTQTVNLLHVDLYRVETLREFEDLGLEEYFQQSVTLIEWGRKFIACFDACILISLQINGENTRLMTVSYKGDRYRSLPDILNREMKGSLC
jgi:tRNA threonylcarbamoyladenosine biosynthesis protein TsaE